jgi:hypothetical protein
MKITDSDLAALEPITISERPSDINVDDLDFRQGQCIANSVAVARKYPNVNVIEGIIIVVQHDNLAKPMEHIWNEREGIHFDVTGESIWTAEKEDVLNAKEIRYCPFDTFSSSTILNAKSFSFSIRTSAIVKALVNKLSAKE